MIPDFQMFRILIGTPEGLFFLFGTIVVIGCTLAIFVAVAADFMAFHERDAVKKERRSIVETGTMTAFFFLFYFLIRSKTGYVGPDDVVLRIAMTIVGLSLLVIGCIVNVRGRFDLGKNWSNQIKIYADHTFVSVGMYRFVRHPLYASLIWMFLGASLVYANVLALLSAVAIFVPFMYYRAKQEERLLEKEFLGYVRYRESVGMFFPKSFFKPYEKI